MMFEIGFTRIKERSGRLIFQNTSLLLTLKRNPNTAVQNREKVCDRSDGIWKPLFSDRSDNDR